MPKTNYEIRFSEMNLDQLQAAFDAIPSGIRHGTTTIGQGNNMQCIDRQWRGVDMSDPEESALYRAWLARIDAPRQLANGLRSASIVEAQQRMLKSLVPVELPGFSQTWDGPMVDYHSEWVAGPQNSDRWGRGGPGTLQRKAIRVTAYGVNSSKEDILSHANTEYMRENCTWTDEGKYTYTPPQDLRAFLGHVTANA